MAFISGHVIFTQFSSTAIKKGILHGFTQGES